MEFVSDEFTLGSAQCRELLIRSETVHLSRLCGRRTITHRMHLHRRDVGLGGSSRPGLSGEGAPACNRSRSLPFLVLGFYIYFDPKLRRVLDLIR